MSPVVGIDPGTGRCGYAVMDFSRTIPMIIEHGCFEYPSRLPIPERLVLLERDVTEILEKHRPRLLAIETLIFNRNITTAMQVSEARGVISLCGAKRRIPVQDCTPLQVKMCVTGYGRSEKAQIKTMLMRQLKINELDGIDDAVDAVAIAITGNQLERQNAFMKGVK